MSIHDGHRSRMKKRYLKSGLDSFDDLAILEFILFFAISRQDTNPLAHSLLEKYGCLSAVLEASPEDLQKVKGIGESAAILLSMMPDVARHHLAQRNEIGAILNSTTKCGEYLIPHFFGQRDEVVWLLCMDAKCKALDCRELFQGNVNAASISVRKVVEVAIACNATSVVLAHNHTSGIALPSVEDEETTHRLKAALDVVGIELIDHVVVAGDDFVSMADSGFFREVAYGF